jgi:hypothetical protein
VKDYSTLIWSMLGEDGRITELWNQYFVYEPGDAEYVPPSMPCPHGPMSRDAYVFSDPNG